MTYKLTKNGNMYIVSTNDFKEDNQPKVKRRGNKGYWNNRKKRK